MTIAASVCTREALRQQLQRLRSAGVPALFARVGVVDESGRLLPPGETG
jgi:hypothetical protein